MDLTELSELLRILEEKEITEFELEEEGLKLRVRKAPAAREGAPLPPMATAPPPVLLVPPPTPAPQVGMPAAPPPTDIDEGLFVVKSPIVGTFYRTPDPNSAPFVNVGDRVSVGQVLCIIEAMKLMNEIEAESAGEIVRIHHESGQPVQYGEPLFSIRPS